MANQKYIEVLQGVILQLHKCLSAHSASVYVHETVWQGYVEVFTVQHPRATRCYAWVRDPNWKRRQRRFIAILATGPIKSAADAVKLLCLADSARLVRKFSRLAQ